MRLTRDKMLTEIAFIVAQRSTCSRAHVGVVVARDGRILTLGYNGAPSGLPHCDHSCDCGSEGNPAEWTMGGTIHSAVCHSQQHCKVSVHAEVNAIAYAAKYGVSLKDAVLYSTLSPCLPCAQLVINAGIIEFRYSVQYPNTEGIDLLKSAGVMIRS